jgi:methylenetetrahydrofolate dehydrogenase (NADP+)/methenyltetrahydrofolate cyclohydrolase
MSAHRLDGSAVAAAIRAELTPRVADFTVQYGRAPALAIVLAGDDPASGIYVRGKEKAGTAAGLRVTIHRLPSDIRWDAVLAVVEKLNDDPECDGILVQAPLPRSVSKAESQQVFDAIDPAKDVDGFHPRNVGLLVQGRATLAPCTPSGIIELLAREQIPVAGRHAVVIGRSDIVGKPMALLLLERDATVTICHSKTAHLAELCATGDLLVAAVGRPGFVTAEFVKPGAVVIDVGINRIDDRKQAVALFSEESPRLRDFDTRGSLVVGDVHPAVVEVAGALTPVPGGVGPLTIAMLLKNTLIAAEKRAGR